jgi:hypothetical protein
MQRWYDDSSSPVCGRDWYCCFDERLGSSVNLRNVESRGVPETAELCETVTIYITTASSQCQGKRWRQLYLYLDHNGELWYIVSKYKKHENLDTYLSVGGKDRGGNQVTQSIVLGKHVIENGGGSVTVKLVNEVIGPWGSSDCK